MMNFIKTLFIIIATNLCIGSLAQDIGERCTVSRTGQPGTCAIIFNCPDVIRQIQSGQQPTSCGFDGHNQIVCCPNPPTAKTTIKPPTNRISARKCIEYGEYVYDKVSVASLAATGGTSQRKIDKCGHTSVPLIVGGTAAKPREFPHMALIGYTKTAKEKTWDCGGTIISDQFVITAGHCMNSRDYGPARYVKTGDFILNRDDDDSDPQEFEISQRIPHPEYKTSSNYNDIALVKLNKKIRLNPYNRPACLPQERIITQKRAVATGWGHTEWSGQGSNNLLKVTLDLFSQPECNASYAYDVNRKLNRGIVEESQLCAGSKDLNNEKDTCQGDSGGPLEVYHQSIYCMYSIIGITSFGKACGLSNFPGVYTRVFNYLDWIESQVWPNNI